MQVIRVGSRRKWAGEREAVDELESWTGEYDVPGVAVYRPMMTAKKKCDFLVLCPSGIVTLEVKGLRKGVSGFIDTPYNSPWTCGGEELDLRLRDDYANPFPQVEDYATSIGGWLREDLGIKGAFVKALVVLVKENHLPGDPVRVEQGIRRHDAGSRRSSLAVTTLTRYTKPSPFKRYFRELSAQDNVIDAPTARLILTTLEAGSFTLEELQDKGFPERLEQVPATQPSPKTSPAPQRPTTRPTPEPYLKPPTDPVGTELEASPAAVTDAVMTIPVQPRTPRADPAPASAAPPHPRPTAASRRYVKPSPGPTTWSTPPTPWRPSRRKRGWVGALVACGLLLAALYTGVAVFGDQGSAAPARHSSAAAAPARPTWIVSPSRNILCEGAGSSLRCDINIVNYSMRTVPAHCRQTPNWGHVVVLTSRGAQLQCPKTRNVARARTGAATVPYGHSKKVAGATCVSSSAHLLCRRGHHGFWLSRADYKTW